MAKAYKFRLRGTPVATATMLKQKPAELDVIEFPKEEMGTIGGVSPSSINEWYVAKALTALGIRFRYQVPIWGGRTRRGGAVLDFLCDVAPVPVVLRVMGTYWHKEQTEAYDRFQLSKINEYFIGAVKVVDLKEEQTQTYEAAFESVKEALGL